MTLTVQSTRSKININNILVMSLIAGVIISGSLSLPSMAMARFSTRTQYTVTATTSGKGSVSKSPSQAAYIQGSKVKLMATPSSGWSFTGWSGGVLGSGNPITVTVNSNIAVTATFTQIQYTISASAGSGGSISPSGSVGVAQGASQTFTITPSTGYSVSSVVVDGSSVGAVASYTFSNVQATHTILASFTPTQLTYTLTVSTVGPGRGSVTLNPPGGTYASGTAVMVTANPTTGSSFSGWNGTLTGSANPATITINRNTTVTATFTQLTYTFTTHTSGGGSVSLTPSQSTYHYGDSVQLQATPSTGWSFSSWSGALTGSANPSNLTVTDNMNVTATFTQNVYTLTVTVSPLAGGSVTHSISAPYHYGDVVVLTESPNTGYSFSSWSGDGTGTGTTRSVTITGNMAVTATFNQNTYSLTVTVSPSSSAGIVTPSASPPYHYGDMVTLTEAPSTGYTFSSWSGDGSGTGSTRSVTITGNMAVTATFNQNTCTLTVNIIGTGCSVTKSPSQSTYAYGASVQLTPVAATGWVFTGWSGGLTGSSSPATITMNGNMVVNATFEFIDTCSTFNSAIWTYNWNAPTVSNGEWVFNVPAGSPTSSAIQAVSKAATFGYGTYTVTFRMTTMTSGVTWSFFLYLDKTASGGAYNELDIPEVNPSYSYPTYIVTYENVETTNQIIYLVNSIKYDDSLTHTMTWNWQKNYIDFYIDGVMMYPTNYVGDGTHTITRSNSVPGKNPFPISDPPMALYFGVFPKGTSTTPWTLYISQIQYQPS